MTASGGDGPHRLPRVILGDLVGALAAAGLMGALFRPLYGQKPAPEICVPRTDIAPKIDGLLDDVAWRGAAVLDNWVQVRPGDNVKPIGRTIAYFTYDRDALYIAVRAEDQPGRVLFALHERDQVGEHVQDAVFTRLDTFDDRRRAYLFAVNPIGVQGDAITTEQTIVKGWNTIFQTAGRVEGNTWSVELTIPFKSLRYPDRAEQRWGLLMSRRYGRSNAQDSPFALDRNVPCQLCQMAALTGMRDIVRGHDIELNPTGVLRDEARRPQLGQPFGPDEATGEVGLNAKYGVGPNLTVDGTINPDFSQVEADAGQIEINNRFALFFPETRPFFLEGADIYETQIESPWTAGSSLRSVRLVHTRRVVDPDAGAKVTGKLGGVSVGLIAARDDAPQYELGGLQLPAAPQALDPFANHRTGYGVARTKVDVLRDGFVGATLTWRHFGDGYGLTAAADGRLRIGTHTTVRYLVAGSTSREADFVSSATERLRALLGDSAAVQATMATLPREATLLDGARRRGAATQLEVQYASRHWMAGLAYLDITRDFETLVGFTPRPDELAFTGQLGYVHQTAGTLQRIQPEVRFTRIYDHGGGAQLGHLGRLADVLWEPGLRVELPRATNVEVSFSHALVGLEGQQFDGLDRWAGSISSNVLPRLSVRARASGGEDVIFRDEVLGGEPRRASSVEGYMAADWRPVPPVRMEVSGSWSRIWRHSLGQGPDGRYAESLIPRIKAKYQWTVRLGFRAIVEYRAERFYSLAGDLAASRDAVLADFLASYVVRSGTTAYLGWTQLGAGTRTQPHQWQRRGGLLKLSYLWRF